MHYYLIFSLSRKLTKDTRIFLIFPRKMSLIFHAGYLPSKKGFSLKGKNFATRRDLEYR